MRLTRPQIQNPTSQLADELTRGSSPGRDAVPLKRLHVLEVAVEKEYGDIKVDCRKMAVSKDDLIEWRRANASFLENGRELPTEFHTLDLTAKARSRGVQLWFLDTRGRNPTPEEIGEPLAQTPEAESDQARYLGVLLGPTPGQYPCTVQINIAARDALVLEGLITFEPMAAKRHRTTRSVKALIHEARATAQGLEQLAVNLLALVVATALRLAALIAFAGENPEKVDRILWNLSKTAVVVFLFVELIVRLIELLGL